METLKLLINKKFKNISLITTALGFSIITLMLRMKLNKSYFYLFLVWNVFLAFIPYVITMYLNTKPKLSRLKLGFWFVVWLLFLPNAPYIITDLIHLKVANDTMLWLDVLMVLSFALTGLLVFYLSVLDMQKLLATTFKKLPLQRLTVALMFFSAFGVYLGRFLRYNSWEILSQPQYILSDVFNRIVAPFQYYETWLFTFSFGSFLVVGWFSFRSLSKPK